jgi:hypothetical protein
MGAAEEPKLTLLLLWGMVATALYWNLRHVRILKTPDHVKVVSILWPLALLGLGAWGVWKLFHLTAKHVVIDTAVSFKNVSDNYRYGSLLPAKASKGNSLAPMDDFAKEAEAEVETLLKQEVA